MRSVCRRRHQRAGMGPREKVRDEEAMQRLIACSDGTWKSAESETLTNVVYMKNAIAKLARDGTRQEVFYDAGVGTGSFLDRFTGGAFGRGLDDNIKDVYRFF